MASPLTFKAPQMILRLFFFALCSSVVLANQAPLQPGHVAVVYNSASQESRELAEFYAMNRQIPVGNLIGMILPKEETIDRGTFDRRVRDPLRAEFTKRQWWTLAKDKNGVLIAASNKIRCLALMKGVPLRISRAEIPAGEAESKGQFKEINEASVDSELAIMGIHGVPIGGSHREQVFQ